MSEEITDWLVQWFGERGAAPIKLLIEAEFPLEEGSTVKVDALGSWHAVDSGIENEFLPISLFNETLTKVGSAKLQSAIEHVNKSLNKNTVQCLAYLVQIYLMSVDYYRNQIGKKSVLFTPTEEQAHKIDHDHAKECAAYINRVPFFNLDDLIEMWSKHGHGFLENIAPGTVSYLHIPPLQEPYNTAVQGFAHSNDYRSITFNGEDFQLTTAQAKVIEILHEHYERGTPFVGMGALKEVDNSGALRDLFRKTEQGLRILQTLITSDGTPIKGLYRLNLPLKK